MKFRFGGRQSETAHKKIKQTIARYRQTCWRHKCSHLLKRFYVTSTQELTKIPNF